MIQRTFILTLLICIYYQAQSQFFSMGTDADSLKYFTRENEKIQLVYPQSFTANKHFFRYLDSSCRVAGAYYDVKPGEMRFLLHSKTLLSNGFVAWAPSRSELFTVPARDLYPGYWPSQLAFHEMRHYMQMQAAHQSIGKLFAVLFGEQLTAAAIGILIPSWYMEGDAVVCETAFLSSGRGRSPSFSSPFFAKLSVLEKIPTYDKWLLGSMNEYYPNQYVLGYWILNTAYRAESGNSVTNIFENAVSMKNSLAPFSGNFRKEMHTSLPHFCFQTFTNLKDSIKRDLADRSFTLYTPLLAPKDYASYKVAGKLRQGDLVAYKTSLHGEPCLVRINRQGKESVIEYTGQIHDESFAMEGDILFFSQYRPDVRRELSDRTILRQLNFVDGKKNDVIERHKSILAPAISDDQSKLAFVEYLQDGRYVITRLETENRQLLKPDTFNYNMHPLQIGFIGNDSLFVIFQTESERSLCLISAGKPTPEVLLKSQTDDIKNPDYDQGFIYFEATFSGNNEIWRYSLTKKTIGCVTSTKFGASGPKIIADTLYYSVTDEHGNYPVYSYPVSEIMPQKAWQFMYKYADTVSKDWRNHVDTPGKSFPVVIPTEKKYKKGTHLFRIHSWGPVTTDPVSQSIGLGLQANSQNLLNTMNVIGYSGYNFSLGIVTSGIKINYDGWYPKMAFSYINEVVFDNTAIQKPIHSFEFATSLPLQFVHKDWRFLSEPFIIMRPGFSMKTTEKTGDSLLITDHQYWRYGLQYAFVAQRYTNSRNIFPKEGGYLGIYAFAQEFDGIFGNLAGVKGGLWLPGMFRHDGIRLRGGYESRDSSAFPYTSLVYGVRPYNIINHPVKSFLSADYNTPLIYPDLPLFGPLLYLKRISVGMSADAGFYRNETLRTIGLHAGFDFNVLRIYAPINCIFSYYRLLNEHKWQFQFGFGINLYSY